MDKPKTQPHPPDDAKPPTRRPIPGVMLMVGLGLLLGLLLLSTLVPTRSAIDDYSYFVQLVKEGRVQRLEIAGDEAFGVFKGDSIRRGIAARSVPSLPSTFMCCCSSCHKPRTSWTRC